MRYAGQYPVRGVHAGLEARPFEEEKASKVHPNPFEVRLVHAFHGPEGYAIMRGSKILFGPSRREELEEMR